MPSLSRRELLRVVGAVGLALGSSPGCGTDEPVSSGKPSIFTDEERRALEALADAIIPPDDEPGGAALGAVPYIEKLLTALDSAVPQIFANGPFSGRQPYPDASGHASTDIPDNDFATWMELDRVNALAWRVKILGSSAVPGGAPNDAILGPVVGLVDQVHQGLAAAIAASPTPLDQLSPEDLAFALNNLDPAFRDLLVDLVTEAAFAAPEYGGNPGEAGWKLCHFEGDSQPLGYSQWDGKKYVERADSPMSTANPGADPAPLGGDVEDLLKFAVGVLGGRNKA